MRDSRTQQLGIRSTGMAKLVTTSIASVAPWSVPNPASGARRDPGAGVQVKPGGGRRWLRKIPGLIEDAAVLLLIVLLFPLVILLVGTPLALFVRLLLEIAQRL